MRLVSYLRDGALRHGVVADAEHVVELGDGDLAVLLEAHGTLRDWTPPGGPRHRLDGVRLRAPLTRPGKLLATAANYQAHVVEGGAAPLDKSALAPRLFLMPPTAVAGPGDPITLPSVSSQIDWEAELVVVVGARARDLTPDEALGVVAGYATGNDVSARSMDYGYPRDTDAAVGFFDWLAGKWPDGFCPFGPYLMTADEVPDPQDLPITLTVNGNLKQAGSTKDMIFTVAELLAFASRLMTLEPGDVLLTGTPAGVGMASGEFLADGDEVTVSIGALGELTNRMVK
ncbi:fumarylacetoacetate hydrolase family protein [Jiangella mangrovi]|uniref:2-keto-4-pentenoate hydratase/2-oxohepta-3-ene-1,7-dioic acid hydratase in catechol pathway n=1 Tax=Jiangella mangrovi TaxID=1524084 RepID=A0A7W9GWC6_9ACTN|nr:fumarylacetoacetate hydrolase family protein [Jiangella mangrovi]MBB5791265.1 2-keto-4-pentenoate hydratase/2-oxohepta-3-ene-1,7-dioic acid hydratase in catechol pathway [Jiangella mangrovi]